MRRVVSAMLMAATAASAGFVPAAGAATPAAPAQAAEAHCRPLERAARVRIRPAKQAADAKAVAERLEREDAAHRSIRGPLPMPDLSRAEIVFSLTIGAGETQDYPTETSSFVWREADGKWHVDRVDHGWTWPIEPVPPGSSVVMDAQWQALQARAQYAGPLAAQPAAELEAALADVCLKTRMAAAPRLLPYPTDRRRPPCTSPINASVTVRQRAGAIFVGGGCAEGAEAALSHAVMYASPDPGYVFAKLLVAEVGEARAGSLRSVRAAKPLYAQVRGLCAELDRADGHGAERMVYLMDWNGGRERDRLYFETTTSAGDFRMHWHNMGCDADPAPPPGS
jgi:hypothetical protein